MGDPKKARKKYKTPSHPWQKNRIEEELVIAIEYGLKGKKEIWKMGTILKNIKNQSKKLVKQTTAQSEKEKQQLISRLKNKGFIDQSATYDDILNITIKNILERRLQTLVHRKGFARTMRQARQFIVYGHISAGDKKITSPSYLVTISEEPTIQFAQNSPLSSQDHPERIAKDAPKKEKKEKPRRDKRDKQRGRFKRQ